MGYRIWVAIRPYARDDDHADDLLQDCWEVILERLHRYGGRGSFAGWAIAVSKNVCRKQLREAKRSGAAETSLQDPAEVADSAPNPEDGLVERESREALSRALERLPERERDAIVLRILEERGAAETAHALDVSPDTVRSLVARAIFKLSRMEEIRQLAMDWIV